MFLSNFQGRETRPMAFSSMKPSARSARALGAASKYSLPLAAACCLLAAAAAGCSMISTSDWCCRLCKEPATVGCKINDILVYWDNRVRYAPDTVHNGTPLPGIAGRVLLFGDDETGTHPMDADGVIVVDLYDLGPGLLGQSRSLRSRHRSQRHAAAGHRRPRPLVRGR